MEETKTDYVLMKETEQNKRALFREDKCDKYDYLAAVACGAVGGLVDIFLRNAGRQRTWKVDRFPG